MRAADWLRHQLRGAPPELVEAMLAALPDDPSAGIPDTLAGGALVLYERVMAGTGGREDALPMLAADALLTHAFEAQAELDPAGLLPLAQRVGAGGRLAELAS